MGRNGKSVFVARSHHGNRRVLPSGVCRHPMLAITRLAHRRHRAFFSNFVFVRSDRQQDFIPGRLSVWDLVHFDHIMVRDLLLQLKLASKRFCRDFYPIFFFCTFTFVVLRNPSVKKSRWFSVGVLQVNGHVGAMCRRTDPAIYWYFFQYHKY